MLASLIIQTTKSSNFIPQYWAISGTRDSFVIPGWVLVSNK